MTIHKLYRPSGPAVWTRAEGWSVPKPLPPHIVAILTAPAPSQPKPIKGTPRRPAATPDREAPDADR